MAPAVLSVSSRRSSFMHSDNHHIALFPTTTRPNMKCASFCQSVGEPFHFPTVAVLTKINLLFNVGKASNWWGNLFVSFSCSLLLFYTVILATTRVVQLFLIVQLSQSEQDWDRQMTFTLFQSTTGDISPSNHTFTTNLTTQSFADKFDNYFATNAAWFNGKCQP